MKCCICEKDVESGEFFLGKLYCLKCIQNNIILLKPKSFDGQLE